MSVTVYFLRLNHMRSSCESGQILAASFDRDKLFQFLHSERVEPYVDNPGIEDDYGNVHAYNKVFRKGGPLEWYNDVMYHDASPDPFGHGIVSEVVEFAREEDLPRIVQHVKSHGVMFLA